MVTTGVALVISRSAWCLRLVVPQVWLLHIRWVELIAQHRPARCRFVAQMHNILVRLGVIPLQRRIAADKLQHHGSVVAGLPFNYLNILIYYQNFRVVRLQGFNRFGQVFVVQFIGISYAVTKNKISGHGCLD